MKLLTKYWWLIVLALLLGVGGYFLMSGDSSSRNYPSSVPETIRDQWMDYYEDKYLNGGDFTANEMENRAKYGWTESFHKHNRAVWNANQKFGTSVNSNTWSGLA